MTGGPVDTATGLQDGSPVRLGTTHVKLVCPDANMAKLARALRADSVAAAVMELTGPGWRVEFMRPAQGTPNIDTLLRLGVVERR